MPALHRLVLLDRDGVINRENPRRLPDDHPDNFIRAPEAWHPIRRSPEAVAALNAAGRTVAICTNQSAIGRGLLSCAGLAAIHERMRMRLEAAGAHVHGIYVCPHRPDECCECRKPKPGLLLAAMRDFATPPEETCFVGDATRDMAAALAAGCEPVLVRTGRGAGAEAAARTLGVRRIHADLAAAVAAILQ